MQTTLNLLKIGSSAKIQGFQLQKKYRHAIEKMYSIGIWPGRDVSLLRKSQNLYIAKIDNDNPFCFREDLAKLININANKTDILDSNTDTSFFKKLFKKVKFFLKFKK